MVIDFTIIGNGQAAVMAAHGQIGTVIVMIGDAQAIASEQDMPRRLRLVTGVRAAIDHHIQQYVDLVVFGRLNGCVIGNNACNAAHKCATFVSFAAF
jgi:hypothetical protein